MPNDVNALEKEIGPDEISSTSTPSTHDIFRATGFSSHDRIYVHVRVPPALLTPDDYNQQPFKETTLRGVYSLSLFYFPFERCEPPRDRNHRAVCGYLHDCLTNTGAWVGFRSVLLHGILQIQRCKQWKNKSERLLCIRPIF